MIRTVNESGVAPKHDTQPGEPPGPEPPGEPTGHPIAPTEFPKKRSGADVGIRDAGRRPTLHHTLLGWRIPIADHISPYRAVKQRAAATDIDVG